jgi:hypothetical protein
MPAHASTCWKRAVPACADFAVYVPSLFAICHQKVYLTLFVYLGFSWLLHIGIWAIPGVPGHGIGGKYAQLQQQLKECACNGSIPGSVTAIYVLQLVLFTVFGLVCTLQVVMALSLTAKTLLEVGLATYVIMYKPWIEVSEAHTQELHVHNTMLGNQAWRSKTIKSEKLATVPICPTLSVPCILD